MSARAALGFVGAVVAAPLSLSVSGCSDDEERARPDTSTCTRNCYTPPVGWMMPSGGDGGTGGGGGTAGLGGREEGVTLTGLVGLLSDDDFELADPFGESVELRAPAANGVSVTGLWNGNVSEPFVLEDVKSEPLLWVHGEPQTSGNDALPTLEPMATDMPDEDGVVNSDVPFVLVRASVIDQIFSVLASPIERDQSQGQVVLQVVGGTPPTGLAGVTVSAPAAGLVIYAINSSFSEIPTETDSSGLVVLANVPSSAWPGTLVDVAFTGAAVSATELRVVNRSVTLVTVEP